MLGRPVKILAQTFRKAIGGVDDGVEVAAAAALATWLEEAPVRNGGSSVHWPLSIAGSIPTPYQTPGLCHLSPLQRRWRDGEASGPPVPSTRPGSEADMARPSKCHLTHNACWASSRGLGQWPALSGGRCWGSSATTFQLIFITDRQPHSTVYCWRPSFSGRRCSCLEQSAWTCHFRTFCGCLPVPSQHTSVWHIISRPRVIVQCLRSDARCFRTL